MKSNFWLTLLTSLLLAACWKYEPQFEGEYVDGETTPDVQPAREILLLQNKQAFHLTRRLTLKKEVPGVPSDVDLIAQNFSRTRIAYKQGWQDIMIIDSSGAAVGTVPNSAAATWFDFHSNNETLYFVSGLKLNFFGPALAVGKTNFLTLFPTGATDPELYAAVVLKDNSVVVGYQYYGFLAYENYVAIIAPNGSVTFKEQLEPYKPINWMRANVDGTRIAFGSNTPNETKDSWEINRFLATPSISKNGSRFVAFSPTDNSFVQASSFDFSLNCQLPSGDYLQIGLGSRVGALDW